MATATLNSGHKIPLVGLGCWLGTPVTKGSKGNSDTLEMVDNALKAGYRHFDTASGYGNEEAVGAAIRASSIPRSEIFVTTKLKGPDHGRVAEAFEQSLELLGLDYIDLYLMHWPMATGSDGKVLRPYESPTINETWADMEALLSGGKVRSIGVSNFSVKTLTQLLETAKIIPAVNQVEAHPFHPNNELSEFSKKHSIHLTAYCPLGQYNSPILSEQVVVDLAQKYDKTPGQILLSWAVQRGNWSVVPKSSNPTRLAQNLETITLAPDEFESLSNLHQAPGNFKSLCAYSNGGLSTKGSVYGWTLEELGWDKELWDHVWTE